MLVVSVMKSSSLPTQLHQSHYKDIAILVPLHQSQYKDIVILVPLLCVINFIHLFMAYYTMLSVA
jgi:hypothetical protein